jgi:hypothetical protein
MKKVFLLSVGMLAVWLLTGCGGGKERFTYEIEGFTFTFDAPKGFFTPSTQRADFYYPVTNTSGAIVYIGETFSMNVGVNGCNYTTELWDTFINNNHSKKELYQKLEIEGVYGTFRIFESAAIRYRMLGTLEKYCINIDFVPNEYKNMASEAYRDKEKEATYLQKCKELSTNKELLEIMKSLKITKK